jgi:hypothetical protein
MNKTSSCFTPISSSTSRVWPKVHHESMARTRKNQALKPVAQEQDRLPRRAHESWAASVAATKSTNIGWPHHENDKHWGQITQIAARAAEMESAAENPSAQLVGNEDRNKDLILGASTTKNDVQEKEIK